MRTIVITPPRPFVTIEDVCDHLKLDVTTMELTEAASALGGACSYLDGPDGCLGRAIGPQLLEARFDGFTSPMRLQCPPVAQVMSVSFIDGSGQATLLEPSEYELFGRELEPAFGASWPVARASRESVRVRYKAGYLKNPDGAVDDYQQDAVPDALISAALMMIADLYLNRETTVASSNAVEIPTSLPVRRLLAGFRIWG